MRMIRLAALGLVFASSLPSQAAERKYGMAGCGLGSVLMGPKGGQISAATTNGSTLNQPFGITSGTSNCLTDAEFAVVTRQHEFLTANLVTLQKEMAQGGGETVVGFLDVLGCSEQSREQGSKVLLDAYPRIFKAPGVDGVLSATKEELRPTLADACQHLS